MADWSFAPTNGAGLLGRSGLRGFAGLGLGDALNTSLILGLNQAKNFRDYYTQGMLDQYRVPAEEARYNADMYASEANRLKAYSSVNDAYNQMRKDLGVKAQTPMGMDQWGLTPGDNMFGSRSFAFPAIRQNMYDPYGNEYFNPYNPTGTQPIPQSRSVNSTW